MRATIIMFFTSMILMSFKTMSQSTDNCFKIGGVFKTVEDFNKNIYRDSTCLDDKKNKIVVRSGYVLVLVSNKKKRKYKAGEIYGYFDGEYIKRYVGKSTFNVDGYFSIIDTNGLIIYEQRSTNYVSYFSWHSKSYYYSIDLTSPIKRLKVSNLEKDIKNEKFLKEIKALKDLSEKVDGIFEINKIYKKYFSIY